MHIRDWPHEERPREKLLARGAGSLSDAELLAIFLGSGLHGRDAVATARELLAQHGPLRALLERPPSELTTLPGLGPARACALAGALELGNRLLHASLERGDAISDPEAAGRYFAQRLRGRRQEVFAALFLDTRHRVLGFEELFQGSVDSAEVHPREVARRALAINATALIVDQPSLRLCRTVRCRPRRHPAPEAGARAGRCAPAGPLRRRRRAAAVDGRARLGLNGQDHRPT